MNAISDDASTAAALVVPGGTTTPASTTRYPARFAESLAGASRNLDSRRS
jgi:hypothetical protein